MTGQQLLGILALLLGALRLGAQSSPPKSATVELPDTRDAQLIMLRLTHADGQLVGFSRPIKVLPTSTFEGEIVNLPLGASVWLAVRSPDDAQGWRVLFPPASTDETGHWHDRVDLPCQRTNISNRCEVMAFVSDKVNEPHAYPDAWFRQNTYKRTEPFEIKLLLRDGADQAAGSLRIGTVADMPADAAQPVVTPATFGIDGTSENLQKGTAVWAFAACPPSNVWELLGQTATEINGSWHIGQLTLPTLHTTVQRGCALQLFAGPTTIPAQPVSEAVLTKWAAIRSARLQLIRNPYFLSIASITDKSGESIHAAPTSTAIAIAGDAAAMEIEADHLPDDVRVWQLLRCDGCETWLAFGPAQLLETGRYLFVRPRFRFPARPLATRYFTMAIASRADLEGAALTADRIARTAIGLSRVIPIENTAATKAPKISVALVSLNGDAVDARTGPFASSDNLITAICKAEPRPVNQTVYLGYRDVSSGRWLFHAATQAGENYRVLAAVAPILGPAPTEANSELLAVLAESLPTDRQVQEEWWTEMTTAVGDSIPFVLPSLPWYRRAGHWLATTLATISSPSNADDGDGLSQTKEPIMNWSNIESLIAVLAACILLVFLAILAWRRRMGARVVFNAWLDARARKGASTAQAQPFERLIQAWTDAQTLAVRKKSSARIARLKGDLTACEAQIQTTYEPEYERLKTKTGRHDASVALGPAAHRTLLLTLTLGESAFNLAVFYVFREPAIYTLLMALAIAVAIPICAFSVGLWIRRWRSPWIATALKLLTTTCVLGLALVGLNHVRMAHLSTVAPAFVREHPELNTAFLSFNAMIFLAAAMVTYWAHDPEENFAEAKHKIERLRKRASRLSSAVSVRENLFSATLEQQKENGKYYTALYRTVYERRAPPAAESRGEAAATS